MFCGGELDLTLCMFVISYVKSSINITFEVTNVKSFEMLMKAGHTLRTFSVGRFPNSSTSATPALSNQDSTAPLSIFELLYDNN